MPLMKDVACRKGKVIHKNMLWADDLIHKGDTAPQRDPREGEYGNIYRFSSENFSQRFVCHDAVSH